MGFWGKLFGSSKRVPAKSKLLPTNEAMLKEQGYKLAIGCRCKHYQARVNVWVQPHQVSQGALEDSISESGGITPRVGPGIVTTNAGTGGVHSCR